MMWLTSPMNNAFHNMKNRDTFLFYQKEIKESSVKILKIDINRLERLINLEYDNYGNNYPQGNISNAKLNQLRKEEDKIWLVQDLILGITSLQYSLRQIAKIKL
jgi:hypothetical protein